MLIDGVISLLKGDTTYQSGDVAALVADLVALTGAGIYENELPRGYTLPAICVHQYGNTQDYAMGGPTDNTEDQVQLDVYGKDAITTRAAATAATNLLKSYVGTLPDGTDVQGSFIERSMAMPFKASADQLGILNRWTLGFRMTHKA